MTASSIRNVLGAALLALLLAGVSACDQDILSAGDATTESESGSLIISLGSVSGSNSVSEADDGTAVYAISGFGPDRQRFEVQSSEATVQVDDLSPGTWRITADAVDATGTIAGTGTAEAAVSPASVSPVSLEVSPPPPASGTLALRVTWPEGSVTKPTVTGRLTRPGGSVVELHIALTGESEAYYESNAIHAGNYKLSVQLRDNGRVIADSEERVHVTARSTTLSEVTFDEFVSEVGDVDISITPDLDEPLVIAIQGGRESVAYGRTMQLLASVKNEGSQEVSYTWYVDGAIAGHGPSLAPGDRLSPGAHRIDVLAFTSDRRRWGSASFGFEVSLES